MFELTNSSTPNCSGLTRRTLLKIGTLGLGGLTLADALRAKASASARWYVDSRAVGDPDLAGRRTATA